MMLSIVVPVYNEEEAIGVTFGRLNKVCTGLIDSKLIDQVELIYVDDGSRDRSGSILKELSESSKSDDKIVNQVLRFSRNFGHSAAVFAGLESSQGDFVAIIDADLQDPPETLVSMIKMLREEKVDVVYGQRRIRIGEGPFKKLTAWLFYRLLNSLSGVIIPKDTGDFRVITREVCDVVVRLQEKEPFLRGLVAWVGFNQLAYPYDRQPRTLGETKYPFRKMLRFAVQAILSFSSLPLRLSIYLGAVGIFFSVILAGYAWTIWFEGRAIPGWTSMIIVLSFGQSLTFFLIGIIGLYLGRIHTSAQNRPRYILKRG